MDDRVNLSLLQKDFIIELMNIGMGQAAASLSAMAEEEIHLSVPMIDLLSLAELLVKMEKNFVNQVVAIKQELEGLLDGIDLLLLPQVQGLKLVSTMMGGKIPLNVLTGLERDALLEIGNIVLNACISSFANVLGCGIVSSLPFFLSGSLHEIMAACHTWGDSDIVMCLHMNFSLQSGDVTGYVAFVLTSDSLEKLKAEVDQYLNQLEPALN